MGPSKKLETVATWYRAASQRYDAGRLLFENAMYVDSAYLAGYVVECSLKGYLLSRIPRGERRRFIIERFVGAKAHDLEYLRWLAGTVNATIPRTIVDRLRRMIWSTALRYEAGLGSYDEALFIIETGEVVLKWAQNNA